jgi:hypothetical protein
MTLKEIEATLWKARKDVFSDDVNVAEQASQDIPRLREMLLAHPDEVARRNRQKAKRNERFLFRWR